MGTTMRGDRRCRCRWSRAEVSRCDVLILCARRPRHAYPLLCYIIIYFRISSSMEGAPLPGRWRYYSWWPSSSSTSRPSSTIAPSSMLRCQRHRCGAGNADAIDATPTTPSVQRRCHHRRNAAAIVNPPSARRHQSRTVVPGRPG